MTLTLIPSHPFLTSPPHYYHHHHHHHPAPSQHLFWISLCSNLSIHVLSKTEYNTRLQTNMSSGNTFWVPSTKVLEVSEGVIWIPCEKYCWYKKKYPNKIKNTRKFSPMDIMEMGRVNGGGGGGGVDHRTLHKRHLTLMTERGGEQTQSANARI